MTVCDVSGHGRCGRRGRSRIAQRRLPARADRLGRHRQATWHRRSKVGSTCMWRPGDVGPDQQSRRGRVGAEQLRSRSPSSRALGRAGAARHADRSRTLDPNGRSPSPSAWSSAARFDAASSTVLLRRLRVAEAAGTRRQRQQGAVDLARSSRSHRRRCRTSRTTCSSRAAASPVVPTRVVQQLFRRRGLAVDRRHRCRRGWLASAGWSSTAGARRSEHSTTPAPRSSRTTTGWPTRSTPSTRRTTRRRGRRWPTRPSDSTRPARNWPPPTRSRSTPLPDEPRWRACTPR